ncbi:hypothetical protein A3206_04275 [Candidatus Methanomassiliicoccus intestinalis]|jgi:hypothetical protein|uniref:hypothetical protein n=1 Tax=Candidatus Methanomassiliicoccus intestinalis TaxID=1406512 RepID=UPI0011C75C8B|nr:hypothetical protein [Candidatus Methanomassiliicoccus intestinalis]TQS80918.1 MAG: hypothetical protein A3206_04275 [Candidatus Methanomassiliicoccus intestinalis]
MKSQHRNILSMRYSTDVLVTVLESKERCKFSDLNEFVTNYSTLNSLLSAFEKEGLVVIEEVMRPHYTRYIDLTDKGREIAEHLKQANKLLNETGDGNEY